MCDGVVGLEMCIRDGVECAGRVESLPPGAFGGGGSLWYGGARVFCARHSAEVNIAAMNNITIVGLGPGDPRLLTREAWEILTQASEVFLRTERHPTCLLYTSDAADERSSVDLGGRRIIKKKNVT